MKTDLISQSPQSPDGHLAGEAFQDEQLRYQGTDVQESAIDAEEEAEPDGELASFSALTLQTDEERTDDEAGPKPGNAEDVERIRILDNSVMNLQDE